MIIVEKSRFKSQEDLKASSDERLFESLNKERKYTLREAFRAGKSGEMIKKVANVLSRQTKIRFSVGVLPVGFENSDGKFVSYRGYAGNMPIRFNFLLNSSDVLYSIDLYEKPTSMIPTRTIMLNGYNIVQIIYMISDVFTGEFERYEENFNTSRNTLSEAKLTVDMMTSEWLKSDPRMIQDIKNNSFDYQRGAVDFIDYIKREFNSSKKNMSIGALQYRVKTAIENDSSLSSQVNPKNVPSINVVVGTPDKSYLLVDKEAQDAYIAATSDDAIEKFKIIEEKTRAIAQGKQFAIGMLVHGRPGTGKTFTIEQILDEEGADWIAVKGGMEGAGALLAILYTNKDDKVILFDDNDSVFASSKLINTLKIALDNKPVRTLGYGTPVRFGGGSKPIVIPPSFEFTSRIIFISNKSKIDPAIQSRLINAVIELNLSLDQMFDLIRSRLPGILSQYPEITNEDRFTVWDFLEKIKPVTEDIDFRRYEACLQEYLSAKDSSTNAYWQKRCAQIMTLPKTWG